MGVAGRFESHWRYLKDESSLEALRSQFRRRNQLVPLDRANNVSFVRASMLGTELEVSRSGDIIVLGAKSSFAYI